MKITRAKIMLQIREEAETEKSRVELLQVKNTEIEMEYSTNTMDSTSELRARGYDCPRCDTKR